MKCMHVCARCCGATYVFILLVCVQRSVKQLMQTGLQHLMHPPPRPERDAADPRLNLIECLWTRVTFEGVLVSR